ncbi:MAG TPA: permease [Candidatus Deferrimicrobiaceae bacterium]|jgi:hypothetical protein
MAAALLELGKDFLVELWHVFPYFLVGVFVGAVIRTFRLHVRMRDTLGNFGVWAIPGAILIAIISPLCSCGTIPIFVSLVSSGVPLAPAMTLLIISPLMSPSGYSITAGYLGLPWANLKVFSALFLGAFAGTITWWLERIGWFGPPGEQLRLKGKIDIHAADCPGELSCTCGDQWSNRLARKGHGQFVIFLAKAWELTLKTGKFTLIGVFIATLAENYLPWQWISGYLGDGSLRNVLLVSFLSVPIHVNEITAAAILYSLPLMAKGPALAFLIGGPVTSIPAMSVLFTMCRRRVVVAFLLISLSATLILSMGFQELVDRYPSVKARFEFSENRGK